MKHPLAADPPPRAAAWTLAVLRALLAAPRMAAQDPAGDESSRIADMVRRAILDNPDTVRDALIKLRERDQAQWQAPSAQAIRPAREPWPGAAQLPLADRGAHACVDRTGSLVKRLNSPPAPPAPTASSTPPSPSVRLQADRFPRHARHHEPQ